MKNITLVNSNFVFLDICFTHGKFISFFSIIFISKKFFRTIRAKFISVTNYNFAIFSNFIIDLFLWKYELVCSKKKNKTGIKINILNVIFEYFSFTDYLLFYFFSFDLSNFDKLTTNASRHI